MPIGIGIGISPLVHKATTLNVLPPAILADGNTYAFYDYKANATIIKDGSNFVSTWKDSLLSGKDLTQAGGTNQPELKADGVYFDGVDNFIKYSGILNQPNNIFIVFKHNTWTHNDYIFDAGNTGPFALLAQFGLTPSMVVYAGTLSSGDSGLPVNQFGIVQVSFNGASSFFKINDNAPTSGNYGTNGINGLTLGSAGSGLGNFGNITVKAVIIRKIADTAPNNTLIYNYLKTKYGV